MRRVGPYQIPFPYEPYPLQVHAMTALRGFLEGAAPSSCSVIPSAAATSIAVLESPTGTGKSQMLLNSVLSYLFEPVYPAEDTATEQATAWCGSPSASTIDADAGVHCRAEQSTPLTAPAERKKEEEEGDEGVSPTAARPKTLDDVLRQRRLEEEVEQLRRERMARVRAQRRQLRRARKLQHLQEQQQQQQQQYDNSGKAETNADFLLAQDPVAWYLEQRQSSPTTSVVSRTSSCCSSSSSISSALSTSSSDGEDGEAEGALEAELATLVPLRKPKVYVASRTHTQLRQLMDDLQETAFARYPLRVRAVSSSTSSGVHQSAVEAQRGVRGRTAATSVPSSALPTQYVSDSQYAPSVHRLTAVHVAGRPHLCLNARLQRKAAAAGGGDGGHSTELLNHYCREAMQYERSKQGRQERRRRQQQQQRGIVSSSHHTFVNAPDASASRGSLRDMEDFNTTPLPMKNNIEDEDKGCAYCAESHLRALLEFLQEEQRAQQRTDHDSMAASHNSADTNAKKDSGGGESGPFSTSTSIYTMERLRYWGNELQACPYLATRLLLRGADVAFIPYSYLLDEGQRAALLGGVTTNPATAAEAEAAGVLHLFDEATGSESELCSSKADLSYNGEVRTHQRERNDEESRSSEDEPAAARAPHPSSFGASSSSSMLSASPQQVSLGSVLYHRRQRVTATAAFRQRQKQQQQRKSVRRFARSDVYTSHERSSVVGTAHDTHGKKAEEEDEVWRVMARGAPPCFRHDIITFDEAHNIADHCRATSTVSLAPWHMQLSERLLQTYLSRYESRLLTRNKQRLRELIRFLGKLRQFCRNAAAALTGPSTTVYPFHTFLFEAEIDSVDVYALLLFLVDSQLLMKLQGFVRYCLETEKTEEEAGGENERAAKRQRVDKAEVDERQRQRRLLASLVSDTAALQQSVTAASSAGTLPLRSAMATTSVAPSSNTPSLSLTALLQTHARAEGTPLDVMRQRAIAADALQRIERVLCMLYVSDAVSTRILWTPASSSAASPASDNDGVLKLVQLEPGAHTFAPLAREARAVVLAGGTMQPLALTCGPLIPLMEKKATGSIDSSHTQIQKPMCDVCAVHDEGMRNMCERAYQSAPTQSTIFASASAAVDGESSDGVGLPVRLIAEGHVVPPTSVRVFTLGTGPSAVRLEFTQQVLGEKNRKAASNGSVPGAAAAVNMDNPADRMLVEVGCTLLNLTRVLPPAGAICFFTSYDAMDRMVDVWQSTGYFAQISEVKRIFRETRGGKGSRGLTHGTTNHSSAHNSGESSNVDELLREYQNWIYGEGDRVFASPSSSISSSPSSLSSCGAVLGKKVTARRGALLFAVMGGRLSEGINFADDLGRAVVVLGMPYANPTDAELQLHLRHIASTRLRHTAAAANMRGSGPSEHESRWRGSALTSDSSSKASPFTSAEEWGLYTDGMMRTVNQCIGRCIRHAGDYAAIVLLDARYGERADVRRRVAAWLQPSLRVCRSFGECFAGLRSFFAERREGS